MNTNETTGGRLFIDFFSLEVWPNCYRSFTMMYNKMPRTVQETIDMLTKFTKEFGQSGNDLRTDIDFIESQLAQGKRYGENGFYTP